MIISLGSSLLSGLRQELRAGDGMEHPLEIVQASHDGGESDDEQGEREESFAPAAGGSPQSECEDETGESCDQRAERRALTQRHGNQEGARRLITEGTDDEGGDEEQGDGGKGADGEDGPEAE